MAGSEKSGGQVARGALFRGATVIVTPTDAREPRASKGVTALWEALGARVSALDPGTHDRRVPAISHLPHVAAWALVDAVGRFEPGALAFAARGFRDTTRIAASDPPMWRDVLLANADAVRASLGAFRAALDELERLLVAGDAAGIEALLARLKATREGLPRNSACLPSGGSPPSAGSPATTPSPTPRRSSPRWPTAPPRGWATAHRR